MNYMAGVYTDFGHIIFGKIITLTLRNYHLLG